MANNETLVFEYALGILDSGDRENFERVLRDDAVLRNELTRMEALVDALGDADLPQQPDPALRERLLLTIQPASRFEGFLDRMTELFDLNLDELRRIVQRAEDVSQTAWEASGVPDIDLLHFDGGPRVATADCGFVRLSAGARFPRHTHHGREIALVIHGEVLEDDGSVFRVGDMAVMEAGSSHGFKAVGEQELILAVVLDEAFTFD